MSAGPTAPLAPAETTIRFSPAAETQMWAAPVGSSDRLTWETSTPSRAMRPSRSVALASRPTAPIRRVGAPDRALAIAWLAPLPPRNLAVPRLSTVSPARGRRSTRCTMSRLIEPKTQTLKTAHLPMRPL